MTIIATLRTLARKVSTYLLNATTTWDSTNAHLLTVPTGKRWFVYGGRVNRDVNSTLEVRYRDATPNILTYANVEAAATGDVAWPDPDRVPKAEWILDAGESIQFYFGVAQGATAVITGLVLEVDV